MVKIKNNARIVSGEVPEGAIPDVSPQGIDATAKLVWSAISNQINRAVARRQDMDGRPGFFWSGKVSRVIDGLWPELSGGYHLTSVERKAIKLEINRYHRLNGSLICRQRAVRGVESLWWVAEHWAEMTVSTPDSRTKDTQEKEDTGVDTTEEVAASSDSYACRDENCTYTAEYTQIRASHERRSHGFRIAQDGEKIVISDEPLSDDDLRALIIQVAAEAGGPESRYYFWKESRRLDPRATQPRVFTMLADMSARSDCDLVVHGTSDYYTYYTLASKVTQKVDELVYNYLNEEPVIDIPVIDPEGPAPASNGLIGEHILSIRKLLSDLEILDSMDLDLNADLRAELDATKAELDLVKNERDQIKRERDQLKITLDTIRKQVLRGGQGS